LLQPSLFADQPIPVHRVAPFKKQLLKWIGNKQRFAHEIIAFFPAKFGTYHEPFLGSGAVLGTLSPERAIASDVFKPLAGIWQTLKNKPDTLKHWYEERWNRMKAGKKEEVYEAVKASYNKSANPADLLFLSRSCYGGVVRFRQADGYMSTPCGIHNPVSPESFADRVDEWHRRVKHVDFYHSDYVDALQRAKKGDLIYCDPPYTHTQSILYGAQSFSLSELFEAIGECKKRGVYVALSIDGKKKSGDVLCELPIPKGTFVQEVYVNCGRSMLRRFQMDGQTLESEVVSDRLLLTY